MFQGMHYVYEVYKEMSFSKAARNLFISQPSLSAAVKKGRKTDRISHFRPQLQPYTINRIRERIHPLH